MAEKINITAIANDLECDIEDAQRLVELFVKSSASILDDFKKALDVGDVEKMFKSAHSLKGSAGTLNLKELSQCALEIEMAARYNHPFDFSQGYINLSNIVSKIDITL